MKNGDGMRRILLVSTLLLAACTRGGASDSDRAVDAANRASATAVATPPVVSTPSSTEQPEEELTEPEPEPEPEPQPEPEPEPAVTGTLNKEVIVGQRGDRIGITIKRPVVLTRGLLDTPLVALVHVKVRAIDGSTQFDPRSLELVDPKSPDENPAFFASQGYDDVLLADDEVTLRRGTPQDGFLPIVVASRPTGIVYMGELDEFDDVVAAEWPLTKADVRMPIKRGTVLGEVSGSGSRYVDAPDIPSDIIHPTICVNMTGSGNNVVWVQDDASGSDGDLLVNVIGPVKECQEYADLQRKFNVIASGRWTITIKAP